MVRGHEEIQAEMQEVSHLPRSNPASQGTDGALLHHHPTGRPRVVLRRGRVPATEGARSLARLRQPGGNVFTNGVVQIFYQRVGVTTGLKKKKEGGERGAAILFSCSLTVFRI